MLKKQISLVLVASISSFVLVACGNNEVGSTPQSSLATGTPAPSTPAPSQGGSTPKDEAPIKSDIDFTHVVWPSDMSYEDQKALELALNISGSFEGEESWSNITDNFDGQGMSLGLLSQNLGSGTLQPLLIQMRAQHPDVMSRIFSQAHLLSLYAMLSDWQANGVKASESVAIETLASMNSGAVAWAVKNVYTSSVFVPQWKSEFQTLAVTPEYINYQMQEAYAMHSLAKAYAAKISVPEIRNYLMMFDIVDQDGYIPAGDFTDYATYVAANPSASNDAKLEEILALRLRHILGFPDDVRIRKQAIINGQGLVHGVQRNLEVQYGFDKLEVY